MSSQDQDCVDMEIPFKSNTGKVYLIFVDGKQERMAFESLKDAILSIRERRATVLHQYEVFDRHGFQVFPFEDDVSTDH